MGRSVPSSRIGPSGRILSLPFLWSGACWVEEAAAGPVSRPAFGVGQLDAASVLSFTLDLQFSRKGLSHFALLIVFERKRSRFILEPDDFRLQLFEVEQRHSALPREPAAGFAGIEDESLALPAHIRLVSMAEDNDVAFPRRGIGRD